MITFARAGFLRCLLLLCLFICAASPALAAKTYSDNLDGTVTDPTTGLTWMRCSMGQTWDGTTCTGTASTYTWDQATALTGTVTFAGRSDWRVPSIRELLTIVDRSVVKPEIDSSAFPNTPASDYWSTSTLASLVPPYSSWAWFVGFGSGGGYNYDKNDRYQVRLVRGGQSLGLLDMARPSADYVEQGDGSVAHTPTQLIWQRCAVGQSWTGGTCNGTVSTFTWDTAQSLTSDYGGQTDWRLPTLDELLSLVDYRNNSPAINKSLFPNTPSSAFWSASAYPSYSSLAWYVGFDAGGSYIYGGDKSNANQVRLVRAGQSFASLALTVNKSGAGTVSSSLPNIDCGTTCGGTYTPDTRVTLNAVPAANLILWGGACASAGTAATCTVTMDAAKLVIASFMDAPVISGLPASLTYTKQNIASTSAIQTVGLSNTGTAALNFSSISASGDFAVTNNCGAGIGAGGFCTLNVTFTPTASGTRSGTLTLTTDAPGSPHTISLSGSGQGALGSLSASSKTFASQSQGTTSAAQTVTLRNTGGAVLNISSIVASGDFVKTTTCGTTLAVATNCTISVTFTPSAVGALSGSLVITSDASNSPNTVTLTGTGLAVPELSLSSPTLSFPETVVSISSAVQSIKLTNTGAAALSLTSITASGDFAVTHNCGSGLGPAGFCNLSVTFTPTVAGNRVGTLTIASNAPGSPHTVALSGNTPAPTTNSVDLLKGWNLLGNGQDQTLPVATLFGDPLNVTTVWKWDVTQSGWQFYAPSMDAAALQTYATGKGYGVLNTINPGEGFWVNAVQAFTVAQPSGSAIVGSDFSAGKLYALKLGWNLVATGNDLTPSAFNTSLSATPPSPGTIPVNLTTLWAWDSTQSKWYFYAPSLDASGGLVNYITGKGYLHFTQFNKTLGNGTGFWVNKP